MLNSGGSRISRRGRRPRRGGVDSRGGYVSKILYVKTKESGPLVGGLRRPRPSRSANVKWLEIMYCQLYTKSLLFYFLILSFTL